ncbi:hypothetical protein CTEN210_01724 [Chaetoceros tenuissimus]|uniref:Uncharacterized protein n=1 Tax=Chaetoceros tenuissimus TaxID=426638 RepID=A0AAD3CHH9_9STRA|nr:hypothetical protein CTEN210_01724 [Chaetoceros tenuissimus]
MSMPPQDGSASLLSDQQNMNTSNQNSKEGMDTGDLLGLDAPAPQSSNAADNFDPFAANTSNLKVNDDDIMSLASELTQGAIEVENAKSMKMNDAFVSLEKMRSANLEIEFGHDIDHRKCVQCIRELPPHKRRPSTPSPFAVKRLFQKTNNKLKKKPKPCLMCGCPTCANHADKAFKKSKVIICTDCSPLFSLDFVIECVSHKNNDDEEAMEKQKREIKHMIDVYDRVRLMLEYSAQFIDEISDTLEKMTKKEDKIGLGANTSGVASGVAGIAAAACFVTPAGPPLLIASLLFSGASQLTSQGSKMVNYYSTPNKIAFKIISLYNVLKSVLTVTTVLRDALLKDHINLEKYVENMIKETEEAVLEMETGFEDENDSIDDTEIDDDNYFSDDDSQASSSSATSANSTSNMSTRTGLVTAYSDITDFPLAKINETEEEESDIDDQSQKVDIVSTQFSGLFANSDDQTNGQKKAPQDKSFADIDGDTDDEDDTPKPVQTVLANPAKSAVIMAAPVAPKGGDVSKKNSNTSTISRKSFAASDKNGNENGQSKSPSKKEQLDKLKEANHFMERDDGVGKLARFYSRSSLAGSSLVSATVTMMAAGAALSVFHFAFEAKNLAATIRRIQAGSPSKRAQALRMIKDDVKNLPDTNVIVEEWDKYFDVLRERQLEASKEDGLD